jgi:hypothetical protein
VETPPDGRLGTLEYIGDLFPARGLELVEHEDSAFALAQATQSRLESGLERLIRDLGRPGQAGLSVHREQIADCLEGAQTTTTTRCLGQAHPVQPRLQRGVATKRRQRAEDLEESILTRVFELLWRDPHTAEKSARNGIIPPVELPPRDAFARDAALDEVTLGPVAGAAQIEGTLHSVLF